MNEQTYFEQFGGEDLSPCPYCGKTLLNGHMAYFVRNTYIGCDISKSERLKMRDYPGAMFVSHDEKEGTLY